MDERNLDFIFLSLTLPVHCVDHFSQEECGEAGMWKGEDRRKERMGANSFWSLVRRNKFSSPNVYGDK